MVKLEHYKEADWVNSKLVETFEMTTPDAKTLFMVAIVNELYTGDPGLLMMQKLIEIRPKYNKGILAFRSLLRRKGLKLSESADTPCQLVLDFNSEMDEGEFMQRLVQCRKDSPKSVGLLIKRIAAFTYTK